MGFSFVHAGDLHLDSPFRGITASAPDIADALQSATFAAYDGLINLCIDRRVQFLLLAGDIYDGSDRSLRAQLRFRDGLQRLADHGIRAFVVHGNHDPLQDRSETIRWPDGVHFFGHGNVEGVTLDVDGHGTVLVSGISHEKRNLRTNLAKKFQAVPKPTPDTFHIGLLHCNVGPNTGHEAYAPCEIPDLLAADIDYWALGHVHEQKILHSAPHIVYPGNPQGLSIREQGRRGCYLVRVEGAGGQVTPEFHDLDVVRWFAGSVPIDGADTVDDLEDALMARIDRFREPGEQVGGNPHSGPHSGPMILRLTLTGRGTLYGKLREENAMDDLLQRLRENLKGQSPFVWVQDLKFDCRPAIDIEERKKGRDFLGQVLRISGQLTEKDDEMERLRSEALKELYGHRRAAGVLGTPDNEELGQMLKAAELLCIELLGADQ